MKIGGFGPSNGAAAARGFPWLPEPRPRARGPGVPGAAASPRPPPPFAAFQPTCCLPQPRTKHKRLAAAEQPGLLSYLAAAPAVRAPDAPLLTRGRRQAAGTGPPRPGRTCFGVRLEQIVLAQFVSWVCCFHSLLNVVRTGGRGLRWRSVAGDAVTLPGASVRRPRGEFLQCDSII